MEQLKKIDKDDIPNLSLTARSVAKIALMVVPFYQSSSNKDNLPDFEYEELKKAYLDLIEGLSPEPNWSSLWVLHNRFEIFDFPERFEKYPAIAIVAMVIPV